MDEQFYAWFARQLAEREAAAYARGFADGQKRRIDKHKLAAALGSIGGTKGGPARAASLSPERRSEIARKAALTRWGYS